MATDTIQLKLNRSDAMLDCVSDEQVRALELVLVDLTLQYRRLRDLVAAKLSAMRKADQIVIGECMTAENLVVQAIADIEKRRVRIVGDIAKRLGSTSGVGTSVTWIASHIPAELGDRLTQRAQVLRELMAEVRKENEVAAIVATRLARHLEGLWSQVAASMNHSKTYGRMGAVQPGPRVVSALDLTS